MHHRALAVLTSLSLAGLCSAQEHHADNAPNEPPLDWRNLEAPVLTDHVQLTDRDMFVKAGESYFSPDGRWIVFQATPTPEKGKDADPFYAMYVARLAHGPDGSITGLEHITRLSAPGSANTCGWFHPTQPWRVLFGSTRVPPSDKHKSGFQVGTNRYVWMFPEEMDVVESLVPAIRADFTGAADATGNPSTPGVIIERPNYDAECSYDPTGRFVLYSHIEDELANGRPDANIYIFDTLTRKTRPIVVAPGYDGGPFFSPDGKRICYRSDRKGNDLLQVFVSDLRFEPDEHGVPVPVGISREFQVTSNDHVNWGPFWHPSGRFLVYASSEVSHRNYEIFAVALDAVAMEQAAAGHPEGTIPVELSRARVTHADGADVLPVFNPQGNLMMWTCQRGPTTQGEQKPSSQVWVAKFNPEAMFETPAPAPNPQHP